MGIFDDAIRQHLDLKRRLGADESELKLLEDEAFGFPARPGDPDFPETGESATEAAAPTEAPAATDAPPAAEPEQPRTPEPVEAPPVPDEPESVADEPAQPPPPAAEPGDEPAPHGDALLADRQAEPEPPPADEGPIEDAGAAGFTTSEREAIADRPTEFFDQAPAAFELGELDLDLEEEINEVGALEEEPLTGEELVEEAAPPPDDATPVDELKVAEETEPAGETELSAEPEEPSAADTPPADGEDVLEETPEFLRENPDDDELWFEQGEPKDFDF